MDILILRTETCFFFKGSEKPDIEDLTYWRDGNIIKKWEFKDNALSIDYLPSLQSYIFICDDKYYLLNIHTLELKDMGNFNFIGNISIEKDIFFRLNDNTYIFRDLDGNSFEKKIPENYNIYGIVCINKDLIYWLRIVDNVIYIKHNNIEIKFRISEEIRDEKSNVEEMVVAEGWRGIDGTIMLAIKTIITVNGNIANNLYITDLKSIKLIDKDIYNFEIIYDTDKIYLHYENENYSLVILDVSKFVYTNIHVIENYINKLASNTENIIYQKNFNIYCYNLHDNKSTLIRNNSELCMANGIIKISNDYQKKERRDKIKTPLSEYINISPLRDIIAEFL